MSLDFTDDQSTLVQVIAWCHQATSHYLSQCWPRSLSLYIGRVVTSPSNLLFVVNSITFIVHDSISQRLLEDQFNVCYLVLLSVPRESEIVMRVSALLMSVPQSEPRKEVEFSGDQHRYCNEFEFEFDGKAAAILLPSSDFINHFEYLIMMNHLKIRTSLKRTLLKIILTQGHVMHVCVSNLGHHRLVPSHYLNQFALYFIYHCVSSVWWTSPPNKRVQHMTWWPSLTRQLGLLRNTLPYSW